MEDLLRQYIREALQTELKLDPHMMMILRNSDLRHHNDPASTEYRQIAKEWLDDLETELGEVPLQVRVQANKFVAKRWQGLLRRFRGDVRAAKQTLYNLLDAKFNDVRLGD